MGSKGSNTIMAIPEDQCNVRRIKELLTAEYDETMRAIEIIEEIEKEIEKNSGTLPDIA